MNLTRRFRFLSSASTFFLLMLGMTLLPRLASAQIEKDTTHWNDEDLYTEDKAAPAFFSVGGGILGSYFIPSLTDFNTNIARPFVGQDIKEHVLMIGGQGFITVPWVKNLRVGGMGYSGAAPCGCSDTSVNGAQVSRMLEYSLGYGALTVDYVLPLRTGHFHIVPGIALGLGSVNIFARQAQNRSGDFSISNDFPSAGATGNITHTYTSKFFLYMPQLQFEYAPLGFMMVRLAAGYQGTSMGTWVVDRDIALGNTTPSFGKVNGSGFIATLGVFFGLFQ